MAEPMTHPPAVRPNPPPPSDWREVDWAAHTRTVDLDGGVTVSYVDIGAGTEPALLLVHGLGGSWDAWLPVLPYWMPGRRIVAVDLPGFGASPANRGVITIDEFESVVEKICAAAGIDKIVAIGSSMGGWVCAELALARPEIVEAVVLIDAAGIYPTPRERRRVVRILRLADRLAPLGCRHRERILRSPRLRSRALAFAFAQPDALAVDLVARLLPVRPSPIFRLALDAAVAKWDPAIGDRLRGLAAPALVVWGERDDQLPVRHGHEWVRLLPNARLVVVPGAGHLPMIEAPGAVGPAVLGFLHALPRAKA